MRCRKAATRRQGMGVFVGAGGYRGNDPTPLFKVEVFKTGRVDKGGGYTEGWWQGPSYG